MTVVPYCYLFSSVVMNRIVCMFGFFVPLENLETSPLPVKGFRSRPMLSTYDHRAVRGFFCVPHLMSHGTSVYNVWQWSCHYLCKRFRYISRLGFEHPTLRLRGKRSNLLRHRRGFGEFSKTFETILTNSSCCIWRKKETCIANPLFYFESSLFVFTFGN